MSNSSEEQREYDEFEAWIEALDVDTAVVDDPADLRAIADAADELHAVQNRLRDAVEAARANGRTWTQIAVGLGVSRQAATKRYATKQGGTSAGRTKTKVKSANIKTSKTITKAKVGGRAGRLRSQEFAKATRVGGGVGFGSDTRRRDDYGIAARDNRSG